MKLKDFLHACHERKVVKMLSIYAVSSWGFLKVIDILWEPLGLPEVILTYLIIALVLGFPFYLYYIWTSRLASGEQSRGAFGSEEKYTQRTFKKVYFIITGIVGVLCIISAGIIFKNKFSEPDVVTTTITESDKIAVLKFGNNTGDPKYDIIGKMASDWIIHGINENNVARVISPEIVSDYTSLMKAEATTAQNNEILQTYFKPKQIISGNYYLEGDQLLFQATISKGDLNETLIAFKPATCPEDQPLQCIEELKQRITGYYVTEKHPELNLQEVPPKFEAFQDVLNAKVNFTNDSLYISLLNKAIADDASYFEPKVLRVAYHYNQGNYTLADSLRKHIRPLTMNNKRQQNLLNHYEALLNGKNDKIYTTICKEYEKAPFDLQTNVSTMVVALQFVNKPEAVEALFDALDMSGMDVEQCAFCLDRMYIKALADIALTRYNQAITTLQPLVKNRAAGFLVDPLLTAYIRSGDSQSALAFLKELKVTRSSSSWANTSLHAAKQFLLNNDTKNAELLLNDMIATRPSDSVMRSKTDFYGKDYQSAKVILKVVLVKDSKNLEFLTRLAISSSKTGDTVTARESIDAIKKLEAPFQFGSVSYALAQYHAAIEDKMAAMQLLRKAASEGMLYTQETFQNDPLFNPYKNSEAFKEILTFWH